LLGGWLAFVIVPAILLWWAFCSAILLGVLTYLRRKGEARSSLWSQFPARLVRIFLDVFTDN
ncbi:MAG TPA: hypothetical protein VIV60_26340, partial [Polyangiaceae bacterium]